MAISKKLLCTLLISALAFSTVSAKSKKKNKSGLKASETTVDENKERSENELDEDASPDAAWQYLEWEEDYPEYVQKYEIVIEEKKNDSSEWTEINRVFTEDNSTRVQIQPLLGPGLYRYKVITYDLIGIPEIESDWFEFNIYRAYIPQVRSVDLK